MQTIQFFLLEDIWQLESDHIDQVEYLDGSRFSHIIELEFILKLIEVNIVSNLLHLFANLGEEVIFDDILQISSNSRETRNQNVCISDGLISLLPQLLLELVLLLAHLDNEFLDVGIDTVGQLIDEDALVIIVDVVLL